MSSFPDDEIVPGWMEGLPPTIPQGKIVPTTWKRKVPPPRQWLYGKQWVRGMVSGMLSPGGLGKSSLEQVDAVAVVTGRKLLHADIHYPEGLRVWYWCGEDPSDELDRRFEAVCIHYGVSDAALGGRLFVDSGRNQPIKIAEADRDGTKVARPLIDELVAQMTERSIDLLVVDPFITCHSVPENDNPAINAVVDAWRDIADKTGAAIELVHHTNKAANPNDPNVNDGRGASAFRDGIRGGRVLAPLSGDLGEQWGLESGEVGRIFQSRDDAKPNLTARGLAATWYRMESVRLNNGNDQYPDGDEIGVVTAWTKPDDFADVKRADLVAVQAAIAMRDTPPAANPQNKDWIGYLVAEVLDLDIGAPGSTKANRAKEQNADRAKVSGVIDAWLRNRVLRPEQAHSERDGRDYPAIVVGEPVSCE